MTNEEMMKNIEKIQHILDVGELLCQLAEECSELAQAALKLRRAHEGINPTPVSEEVATYQLTEEVADVMGCLKVLEIPTDDETIQSYQRYKFERWVKRLEGRR